MPKRLSINEFIHKANNVHGAKYDYSKVIYINAKTNIIIICKQHGEFKQSPSNHLNNHGCPKCGIDKQSTAKLLSLTDFKIQANKIHDNIYDYSYSNYTGFHKKICIICPKHGEFWQTPANHITNKCKCPKCIGNYNYNTEEWINIAMKNHNNKYDYNKVNYKGNKTKICIICPKHGEFWQTPNDHLSNHGCPSCCNNYKGENKIKTWLKTHDIGFNSQQIFDNCKDKQVLSFDFHIPSKNLLIEYDGIQHFKPIDHFGGTKSYEIQIKHDDIKNQYANDNNINLLRIPYWEYNNISKILKEFFDEK